MKERIYLWDNMKVILMMLVVVTHSVNIYQLLGERWIQFLWVFIMTFTMPAFMIISGFWFKKRSFLFAVKRYLYPCILFSCLNNVIGYISGAYPNGIPITKAGWSMWFLWALFCYSIITPPLLTLINKKQLFILSLLVAFIGGFKFLPNDILDAQRVMNFYPFYCIGLVLRDKEQYIIERNQKKFLAAIILLILGLLIFMILTIMFPGFCYGTGFMNSHGISLGELLRRWIIYTLTIVMSIAFILVSPKRKLPFTEAGTRTMNVYMLHMVVIFPLCWFLLRPLMHKWYGYILYLCLVPILCSLLFSKLVDRILKPILDFPNKYL